MMKTCPRQKNPQPLSRRSLCRLSPLSLPRLAAPALLAAALLAAALLAGCASGGTAGSPGSDIREYTLRQEKRTTVSSLSNGIPVILQEAPESPVLTIRLVFTGPALLPEKGKEGLSALTLSLMARGSQDVSYEEVQSILYQTSASLSPSGGSPERASFSRTVLPRHFGPVFQLYQDLLLHPRWDPGEWERLRRDYLMNRQQQENNPFQRTRLLARESFFQNHPYGAAPGGNLQSLQEMKLENLKDQHRKLLDPSHMLLIAAGPLEELRRGGRDPVRDLEKALGSLEPGTAEGPDQDGRNRIPSSLPASEEKIRREPFPDLPGLAYAEGYYPMPPAGHPDRPALTLAYAVWKDLLFEFLRTRHSACYSTWASLGGLTAGYGSLTIYKTSEPSEAIGYAEEARRALLAGKAVAANISTHTALGGGSQGAGSSSGSADSVPPGTGPGKKSGREESSLVPLADVLDFYKAQYLTNFYQGQQTVESTAAQTARSWILEGEPHGYLKWPAKIQDLTAEEIQGAADRWLSNPPISWVILGDEKILRQDKN